MHTHARGGGEFDEDVVVVEFDGVVTRRGSFVLVLEPSGLSPFDHRQQKDVAVIRNARAAEVRVTKSVDDGI